MGDRDRAERDAMTVEIVFAVVTAALLAAVAFAAVCAPAFLASGRAGSGLVRVAACTAGVVFLGRVVDVLLRFGRRGTEREIGGRAPSATGKGRTPAGDQPIQPGRTSPDS
ncbi:DUF6332 family protein [Streptomyces sp. NPDC057682]|uniref:DUF6332 family protein n=1 Tax=Streptomyces sp. NPDC057682 TaxID=3346210 RepID=UPI00368183A9